jgi:hypothetical protein
LLGAHPFWTPPLDTVIMRVAMEQAHRQRPTARLLITPYFVFLHFHKTGGMFVRKIFAEWRIPNDVPKHGKWVSIPEQYRDLPVLGFVRNPWDWYVSFYSYLRENPDPFWKLELDSFEAMLRSAMEPNWGPGWHDFHRRHMTENNCDFMTAEFRAMFGPNWRTLDIGKMENLRKDLLSFCERRRVPITRTQRQSILEARKENGTRHPPYRELYSAEMAEVVRARNNLVDWFGYEY